MRKSCSGRSKRTTKAERLRNIEAHLLNLLELIESKPGITAAADNLLQAARASRLAHDPARARLLREAVEGRVILAHLAVADERV
jgi:hypothetical protein